MKKPVLPLGQEGSPLNEEEEQGCRYAARSLGRSQHWQLEYKH